MCLGFCHFAAQVLLERIIPEAYQGYWAETFIAISLGTIIVFCAQRLGTDLIGPRRAINKKAEDGYTAYRRADVGMQWMVESSIISTFLFLFKNETWPSNEQDSPVTSQNLDSSSALESLIKIRE